MVHNERVLRTTIVFAVLLAAVLAASPPLADSPEKLLEAAIYRAKVLGDLPGAIQQFESIATRYEGKPVAAQALVEIAHAEELLGHKDRARSAYKRVLDNYPAQVSLVARARQNAESAAGVALAARGMLWVRSPASPSPSPRCCMGMAYDAATHATLLFGGFTRYACFSDTWIWRDGWHQLAPATSPSARTSPAMAFDAAAENVVLFGGVDGAGRPLNDTWTWDGNTWTEHRPPVSPAARQFDAAGMAYHPATRKVVLFGGAAGGRAFGDTWTWDGLTKTWTQQFPASSPSPRRTSMAYDEAGAALILFGGHVGGAVRNDRYFQDTWSWNGKTWRQLQPATSPSARGMISLAYSPTMHAVVLFGGFGKPDGPANDSWLWSAGHWTEIHPATPPATRWNMGLVFDPAAKGLLLFGGFDASPLGDTWTFISTP